MVTSPSGKNSDWPERTGCRDDHRRHGGRKRLLRWRGVGDMLSGELTAGVALLGCSASGSSTSEAGRPSLIAGGMSGPSIEGRAPSMPMTRTLRGLSFRPDRAVRALLMSTPMTSRTTGRRRKNPAERAARSSRPFSQSSNGNSGVSARARKERPLRRMGLGFVNIAVILVNFPLPRCTDGMVNRRLKRHEFGHAGAPGEIEPAVRRAVRRGRLQAALPQVRSWLRLAQQRSAPK